MKKLNSSKNTHIVKLSKFLTGFALLFIGFTSCDADDILDLKGDCFRGSWIEEVSNELTALTTSLGEYSAEPTLENCKKYKSAIVTYIGALNSLKECVPALASSFFNESLKEAKEELEENNCE